jgi:IS1 family transposase
MNRLSTAERAKVISVLVEGNSLRATARITGVARMTIEKLLRDIGAACQTFHDATVRGLKSQRIQCDEIWSFIGAKEKNASAEQKAQGWGDVWTWTCLDPDTKLMVSWFLGDRSTDSAYWFMQDVASRLTNRVQVSTDGYIPYQSAIDRAFGDNVDFGIIKKTYAAPGAGGRYSPPKMVNAKRATMWGAPDPKHVSTSHVERNNLTMRMHMRRYTRLTNGFSKKLEMHAMNLALHFTYYNFCKIHQSLRVTPAMQAGLSDHVWEIEELVALLETLTDKQISA